ncbi:phosphoglycerate mutase-like protein [Tuber magnatum]|uniref:3-phytase n=1 Tax=Tuber magnatum TaxID=42249 RepID=A0A317T1Z7_9PEZI|nr:phosphoglycerate mutase-like protein [Tuber magnatum]
MPAPDSRHPYSPDELAALYPSNLRLHLVHVIFRHGERTPVVPRFQNAGLAPFWPYCQATSRFKAAVMEPEADWSFLTFQRRMETFGKKGGNVVAMGPGGEKDNVCPPGELTDRGRETTLQLGQRLRHLYVHQLGFLPENLGTQSECYLRSSPIARALESLEQVFTGLYPSANRSPMNPPLTIYTRSFAEENIFPNNASCRRLDQLSRAFAKLAAEKWNDSPEMQHLQSRIGKWVDGKIAVDGHPNLCGITDTVNATLAHGETTKLPNEFYEPRVREIMDDITVDEWYRGYSQSSEYRRLGVGSLLGDVKDRMLSSVNDDTNKDGRLKIGLMGCHDTTIAGLLASLGGFDKKWPPFTSSIAFEMFREKRQNKSRNVFSKLFGATNEEEGWYVRLKYNDKPVYVKGCKMAGRHLEGDESFCTLTAFKEIVEKMVPKDLKDECLRNMDKTGIPPIEEVE